MKLLPLLLGLTNAECPCKEISKDLDYGEVVINNEHADQER